MEKTVNERISQLIDSLRMNPNSFAKSLGVSSTVIYNIIDRRKSKPGFEIIEGICTSFNVNSEWLISGSGEMFKSGNPLPPTSGASGTDYKAKYEEMVKKFEEAIGMIDFLKKQLTFIQSLSTSKGNLGKSKGKLISLQPTVSSDYRQAA